MRFSLVVERLARLPDPLPPGPVEVRSVALVSAAKEGSGVGRGSGAGRGSAAGRRLPLPSAIRDAAGLVLLYPDPDGETHLVLIRRAAGDYRHAGEISLPGGAVEPGDADLEATALREAGEEVGLDPGAVGLTILGRLDPVEVRVSGFRLRPVLALAHEAPRLRPDGYEVEAILEPVVDHFLPQAPIERLETQRDGWRLRYGAYPAGGLHVWGATARVLGQLGAVLGPALERHRGT